MYGDYPIATYINILPKPKVVPNAKAYGEKKLGKRSVKYLEK